MKFLKKASTVNQDASAKIFESLLLNHIDMVMHFTDISAGPAGSARSAGQASISTTAFVQPSSAERQQDLQYFQPHPSLLEDYRYRCTLALENNAQILHIRAACSDKRQEYLSIRSGPVICPHRCLDQRRGCLILITTWQCWQLVWPHLANQNIQTPSPVIFGSMFRLHWLPWQLSMLWWYIYPNHQFQLTRWSSWQFCPLRILRILGVWANPCPRSDLAFVSLARVWTKVSPKFYNLGQGCQHMLY